MMSGSHKSKIENQKSKMACLLTLALALGCDGGDQPAPKLAPAPSTAKEEHSHGAGPHEGTLADWGGGKYHVEFCVDHDKQEATVYILGGDEKTAAPVKADNLLLSINDPKFQIELVAAPQEGETEGTASRFIGKHESLGKVQKFAGTISGEVEGTPYAGDFKEESHGEHKHKK
jgi:hypothetical protein